MQETCKGALDAGFRVTLLHGAHSTYDIKEKSAKEIEKDVEELLTSLGVSLVGWEDAVKIWKTAGRIE